MGKLNGKVALITGGGTGLGIEFAKRYVEEGAKVVLTGRRKELLDQAVASLPAGCALAVSGDVSKLEDAQAMVDATVKFGGKIDILVNNAGIDPAATAVDITPEQWHKVLDINLTGPLFMMKAAIPYMIENGGGSIINISSLAGVRCIPAMPAYTASKAGMIGLSQAIALDYGRNNIRCNVICPGAVATEMLRNSMSGLGKALGTDADGALAVLTKFLPIARAANADEINGAAVFLASDDSSYMTGSVMVLDGGACILDPNGCAVASSGAVWG